VGREKGKKKREGSRGGNRITNKTSYINDSSFLNGGGYILSAKVKRQDGKHGEKGKNGEGKITRQLLGT